MVWTQEKYTLTERDHLGDWSPEEDCYLRLTFRHPYIGETTRNLTMRLNEHKRATKKGDWNYHLTLKMASAQMSKRHSPATVLHGTPIIQMIFFNQRIIIIEMNKKENNAY